ncbi:MAG: hypothetical protein U0931_13605 [Vulcanimicrobiota bacterium]
MDACDKPRRENLPWYETEAKVLRKVKADLGAESKAWKWLQKAIHWDSPDLKTAATEQILAEYPAPAGSKDDEGTPEINDSRLLRTMIWQSWVKIQASLMLSIDGNLRSFWYQVVKPFYRRHNLLEHGRGPKSTGDEVASTMNGALADFVSRRVFEYGGAFQFHSADIFWQRGKDQPRILLFFEKRGMYELCKWAYKNIAKISYMASRGQPSFLELEKFSKDFADGKVGTFIVGGFPDWDPFGWKIMEELDAKLRFLGQRVARDKKTGEWIQFKVKTYMLTSAKLFTEEDIASGDDLSLWPKEYQGQIQAWLDKGGGVNGKPIALSVDAIPVPKMKVQMERFVDYATGDQMDSKYVRIKPIDTDSIRHTFQDFSLDDDRYRIHPRDFVLPSPIDDTYEA